MRLPHFGQNFAAEERPELQYGQFILAPDYYRLINGIFLVVQMVKRRFTM
jgi:hypothetical protein